MVARMATEVFQWGDAFELDVPVGTAVNDAGELAELRLPGLEDTPVFLVVLSPHAEPSPEAAVTQALRRFAASRGVSAPIAPETYVAPDGIVSGRLSFVVEQAWEALALAWNHELVLAFTAARETDSPVFDRATELMASLRPCELIVPRTAAAEAVGDW